MQLKKQKTNETNTNFARSKTDELKKYPGCDLYLLFDDFKLIGFVFRKAHLLN